MEQEQGIRVWLENIFLGFLLSAICIIGIIGNITTFVVLSYQHQRKRRVLLNYFLLGLTVFDTVFLLFWLGLALQYAHRLCGEPMPKKNFATTSAAYFSLIVKPSGYIGQTGSIIFIVAITVDRYLTVCHTRIAKIYWKKRVLVCTIVLGVLVAVSLAYAIPAWLSYDVIQDQDNTTYILNRNSFGKSKALKTGTIWLNTIVTMIIPLPVLVVLNSLIFQNVHKSLKERIALSESQISELSLAKMLICVVLVFGICNAPSCFILVIFQFANKDDRVRVSDAGKLEAHYIYTVLRLVQWVLLGVNSSVNFLIYCTMSQSFRKTLKELIKLIRRKFRRLIRTEDTVTSQGKSTHAMASVRFFSDCSSETEAPRNIA